MRSEFLIRILSSEPPFDGSSLVVARLLPSINLGSQQVAVGDSPVQALTTQDADLDLRHVQPTRVLGCVVELHATQEPCGRAPAQHIVEALSEVSVQVVQHQMNTACLGVCAGEKLADEGHEVNLAPVRGDRDDALAGLGFHGHEQIGNLHFSTS